MPPYIGELSMPLASGQSSSGKHSVPKGGLCYRLIPFTVVYGLSRLAVWSMTLNHKCFHVREMMFSSTDEDTNPYRALLNGEF